MKLAIAAAMAISASVMMAFALYHVFRSLHPTQIGGYRACKGGWWEAKLNRCEVGLLMLPQQPVNTYSNLAYVACGLFMAFYLGTYSSYIIALASLYLCVGSALYHATSTRWAGSLDVSGIYAVFAALTAHSLNSVVNLGDPLVALVMFVSASLLAYFLRYRYRGLMELKVGIFLILIYAPAVFSVLKPGNRIAQWPLIISAVFFVLGFACWWADKYRFFPFKRWGHGLWHMLTAAGIGLVFYAGELMQR